MSLAGKTILVTGGTGSMGCAFIPELLLHHSPHKVIVYSRDEVKQAQMARAIQDERMRFFLGDVRDIERLRLALHGVDVVVHAAALKRVDACEYNPQEAVRTNVEGSRNVVLACIDAGVERALLLSTDKASAPTTLYGSTKLCAERMFLAANDLSGGRCKFSCTRYGNVSGSRGSIIPTWAEQKASGNPVLMAGEFTTRFWMRQQAAIELVLHALQHMQGGEVYIPKLSAFRLGDLRDAMGIQKVTPIALGMGEKEHESLIAEAERRIAEDSGYCYVLHRSEAERPLGGPVSSDSAVRMTLEQLRAELGALGVSCCT